MRVSKRREILALSATKLSREDQIKLAATILDGLKSTQEPDERTPVDTTIVGLAANLMHSENVDARLGVEYGDEDNTIFDTNVWGLFSDTSEEGYRTLYVPVDSAHRGDYLNEALLRLSDEESPAA